MNTEKEHQRNTVLSATINEKDKCRTDFIRAQASIAWNLIVKTFKVSFLHKYSVWNTGYCGLTI